MRIYQSAMEMIKEVERDLAEMGIRYQSTTVQDKDVHDDPDYETIELVGYAYKLSSAVDDWRDFLYYKKNSDFAGWAEEESEERLDRGHSLNPGDAWRRRTEFWAPFLRRGLFSYTYIERW